MYCATSLKYSWEEVNNQDAFDHKYLRMYFSIFIDMYLVWQCVLFLHEPLFFSLILQLILIYVGLIKNNNSWSKPKKKLFFAWFFYESWLKASSVSGLVCLEYKNRIINVVNLIILLSGRSRKLLVNVYIDTLATFF